MNTRSLTGNRDRDKGWSQNADGNWTPSVYDRRRVAVAHINIFAEAQNGAVLMPQVHSAFVASSTSPEDLEALVANYAEWRAKLSA